MRRWGFLNISLFAVILIVAPISAQEITTFLEGEDTTHEMGIGHDGAVWLCLGHPPRIVKVLGDAVSDVPFNGHIALLQDFGADVYFSPSGQMLVFQQGAEDGISCQRFLYYFNEQNGLSYSGLEIPQSTGCDGLQFDARGNLFTVLWDGEDEPETSEIVELSSSEPISRYIPPGGPINSALIVSIEKAWLGVKGDGVSLVHLGTRTVLERLSQGYGVSNDASYPATLDGNDTLWFLSDRKIMTFSGHYPEFYEQEPMYNHLVVAADGTVWAASDHFVAHFARDATELFDTSRGILSTDIRQMLIDHSGNVWLRHPNGLTRISGDGPPSQSIYLINMASGSKIMAGARLENSGEPLCVDVYVAMELNGKLQFWPHWSNVMDPYPVDLFRGFGFDGVIAEGYASLIPPGTYRFYAAITLRDTMNFIGPIDVFDLVID
ncbi:hypothetical protein J7M28_07355 [bacterium]|nr:hypothetical protein [bacterium]